MLVLERSSGKIAHRSFSDLLEYLTSGDLLVVNDTRVSARRLRGERPNGMPLELLLMRPVGDRAWEALAKPAKSLRPGTSVVITDERASERCSALVTGETSDGGRIFEFKTTEQRDRIALWGDAPLPPYIHEVLPPEQEERYQTVYSRAPGSAAAPTAGLHFTEEMLQRAAKAGIHRATVTLTVGVGTFRPVRSSEIEEHEMHAEEFCVTADTADAVNRAQGRVVAVGTTSVRSLEAAAAEAEARGIAARVAPTSGDTRLFLKPGSRFRAVDALITNFHLPKSTLLMLVCAFAGYEQTMQAYHAAVDEGYRFFSFGDSMLVI